MRRKPDSTSNGPHPSGAKSYSVSMLRTCCRAARSRASEALKLLLSARVCCSKKPWICKRPSKYSNARADGAASPTSIPTATVARTRSPIEIPRQPRIPRITPPWRRRWHRSDRATVRTRSGPCRGRPRKVAATSVSPHFDLHPDRDGTPLVPVASRSSNHSNVLRIGLTDVGTIGHRCRGPGAQTVGVAYTPERIRIAIIFGNRRVGKSLARGPPCAPRSVDAAC